MKASVTSVISVVIEQVRGQVVGGVSVISSLQRPKSHLFRRGAAPNTVMIIVWNKARIKLGYFL